jgi:hypothetical protein
VIGPDYQQQGPAREFLQVDDFSSIVIVGRVLTEDRFGQTLVFAIDIDDRGG